jgi:hypothetical protein
MTLLANPRQIRRDNAVQISAPDDAAGARALQRAAKQGTLLRLGGGVYVLNGTQEEVAFRVRSNWQKIAGALYPGAVVSHLSAFQGGITDQGILTLSSPTTYNKTKDLPALGIVLLKGPGQLPGDMALGDCGLFWASRPRALLENLGASRALLARRAGRAKVEEQLINILNASGEAELNRIRDSARALAEVLDAHKEFQELDSLVGALLGTHAKGLLKTRMGQLVAIGTPADSERLYRFERLAQALQITVTPRIPDVAASGDAKIHFAFLESYFSNFVEGTRFSIQEAQEIVLRNRVVSTRPQDSHDVLGVFALTSTTGARDSVPAPGPGFVLELMARHQRMLARRPEAKPGELKIEMNYAGANAFVAPAMVRGTLQEGSAMALTVPEGLARALFYAFLVSEVHPFTDGNGRLSRLLMNAELSRLGLCRVIIPILYHPQYVDCQKLLSSSDNDPVPFIKAICRMARWCAGFDYADLARLIADLSRANAFQESPNLYRLGNADGTLFDETGL